MAQTITITEEAQAFFKRNPESMLKTLVDQAVREYSAFMGGLPAEIDVFQEEDALNSRIYVAVVAEAERGSLREKHHEFMTEWRTRHSLEELRAVGFSYHYL